MGYVEGYGDGGYGSAVVGGGGGTPPPTFGITATAAPDTATIRLDVTPSSTGTVYVLRRDSLGVAVVRGAYDGLAVTAGVLRSFDDFEARQGDSTDYLLTDDAGVLIASTNLVIPSWGTWLKSPAKPWLNVRTALRDDDSEKLPANRELVRIEGAPRAVVLSGVRLGSEGTVTLSVRTEDELRSVRAVLADGGPVLLDLNPSWGISYRYVSVGDVTIDRDWHELGMDKLWRAVKLDGLVDLEAPLGPLDLTAGATYDQLPVKFPTYTAIPALVPTYNELATA